MRKIKFIAAAIAVLAFSTNSFAQPESFATLGVSYNPVTFTGSIDKLFSDSEKMTGVSLFFDNASPLSHKAPIYIDYGLTVQYTGKKQTSDARISFLGVKVPVNFLVDIPFNDFISLAPYAGVSGSCYILGQAKFSDGKIDFFKDKSELGEPMNRFGCNWQAGARLYLGPIMVGFAYEGPITNLYGKSGDIAKMNSKQMNISLGFRF